MKIQALAFASALALAGGGAQAVTFDFANSSSQNPTFQSGGITLTTGAANSRMALATDGKANAQGNLWGLGVNSCAGTSLFNPCLPVFRADGDPISLGGSTVTWTLFGPGETLFLNFSKEVSLNSVSLLFPLGGQIFPSTTAFAYSIDANGNESSRVALNSWFGDQAPTIGGGTFNTSALNTSMRFAISGLGGIDHVDTTVVVGGVDVTPVPEASTYAMMIAGLGAIGFIARRRKQQA